MNKEIFFEAKETLIEKVKENKRLQLALALLYWALSLFSFLLLVIRKKRTSFHHSQK